MERRTLSIPEAAETLGISRAHAYNLAAKGELPVVKFGNRKLVPILALDKLLAAVNEQVVA